MITTITTTIPANMIDDFMIRAGLAGLAIGLATGPLGCFVVWRRMAYFGDAVAHAAILGVALALLAEIHVMIGIVFVAIMVGLAVLQLSGRTLAADAILGVLAHSALAFGLVAVSLIKGPRLNLDAYLFGDILTIQPTEVWAVWAGAAAVIALLLWRWRGLLTTTMNPDLALASGLNPKVENWVLTLCLALVVAVSIKIIGALLIAALLVIPAAAARHFARTPENMALCAAGIAATSVLIGLWASFQLDVPSGPSIVCASAVIFVLLGLAGRIMRT
ncbi:metal ABC transporter permease [Algirhabdus cladophorae]|uniref:metal ABC transporter permease n=1 Tax=Algirhabdus cladophorae TaxID=3377108 RepID=UPI003B84549B